MDHGHLSEKILYDACVNIFGEDLVFLSPNVISETGKTTELTDILVLIDKYLITIQSKSLQLSIEEIDDIKMGRIVNKYEDAKRQVNRTINSFERKMKVVLHTNFDKDLILPWENVETLIPIITINISDDQYLDPEFRFQFPLKIENHRGFDTHTFMLRDFYNLITEFNTAADFLRYLEERKYLSNLTLHGYTNELDLVAIFVSQYHFLEKAHAGNFDMIAIEPGIWESYKGTNKEEIAKRNKKKFAFSIVDATIKELRSAIDYTMEISNISIEKMTQQYFHLIGIFALLSRVEVVHISETFKEKLESTRQQMFRYFIFPKNTFAIFFLIVNERDREIRKQKLIAFVGHAAKYLSKHKEITSVKEIIGIATEGMQLPGRSLDIINAPIEEALNFVDPNDNIELFRDVRKNGVDEWKM